MTRATVLHRPYYPSKNKTENTFDTKPYSLFLDTKGILFSVCKSVCVLAGVNSSPVVPGCLTIVRVAGWKPSNSSLM